MQLSDRRYNAPLKIPKGFATIIVKDNTLRKMYAYYFELKPLFSSGCIKNARYRNAEIAEYLGITERTWRKYREMMIEHEIAWFDQKDDFYLLGHRQLAHRFKLKNYFHEVRNIGYTEGILILLAVFENQQKQERLIADKVFTLEALEDEINYLLKSNNNLGESRIPLDSPQQACEWLRQAVRDNKSWRKKKQLISKQLDFLLAGKYHDQWEKDFINNNKSAFLVPFVANSCKQVARMMGRKSSGTGWYWETKLQALGYLDIKPWHVKKLPALSPIVQEREPGVISMRFRDGKRYYNRILPNQLTPLVF